MESLRSVDREIICKDKNLRKKEKREKKGDKEGGEGSSEERSKS